MRLEQASRLVIFTSVLAFTGVLVATLLGVRLQRTQRTFERRVQEEAKCGDAEDRSRR